MRVVGMENQNNTIKDNEILCSAEGNVSGAIILAHYERQLLSKNKSVDVLMSLLWSKKVKCITFNGDSFGTLITLTPTHTSRIPSSISLLN